MNQSKFTFKNKLTITTSIDESKKLWSFDLWLLFDEARIIWLKKRHMDSKKYISQQIMCQRSWKLFKADLLLNELHEGNDMQK